MYTTDMSHYHFEKNQLIIIYQTPTVHSILNVNILIYSSSLFVNYCSLFGIGQFLSCCVAACKLKKKILSNAD